MGVGGLVRESMRVFLLLVRKKGRDPYSTPDKPVIVIK